EERDRLVGEQHLGCGRELLADSAHRLAGRARGDLGALGEHDVARSPQRQVVGDAGAYRAAAGDDDSSHSSSSPRSSGVSVRSGRRTSGPTGTPRAARTIFAAAWKGKRSSAARTGPSSTAPGSRTADATSSGKTDASADTAPAAPAARPRPRSASGPTKTSSPSTRYAENADQGVSETLRPRKFAASSRRRSSTTSGTA